MVRAAEGAGDIAADGWRSGRGLVGWWDGGTVVAVRQASFTRHALGGIKDHVMLCHRGESSSDVTRRKFEGKKEAENKE